MQTIILCGGKSSRFYPFGESKHKSLFKIMGKCILDYSIESAAKISKDILIVKRPDFDEKLINTDNYKKEGIKITFITQQEALGQGNAICLAKKHIKNDFFVISPILIESYYLTKKAIQIQNKSKKKIKAILFGIKTKHPQLYGIVRFKNTKLIEIVEKPNKGQEPSNIRLIGLYYLSKDFLDILEKQKQHHYNFENALNIYIKNNNVNLQIIKKETKTLNSLKYAFHLLKLKNNIFDLFFNACIEKSAKISQSAIIGKNVYIGKNTIVMENTVIKNNVFIGDNCIIGNHCLIRDYCNIENNVVIGAFSEIKNSIIYSNTSIHRGYIGDSVIGQNCRFGAGCVTSNRLFRKNKNRPEIKIFIEKEKQYINTNLTSLGIICGDNVDIGTNVNFMPGVIIKQNSKIMPNTLLK